MKTNSNEQITVGWREWVSLPDLELPAVKVKVDSGAKTSAIHAFSIVPFDKNGEEWVKFGFHPISKSDRVEVFCQAAIKDRREVTDSGGHKEMRYVIESTLKLGKHQWPIDLTLTNRDTMRFRMLLGRRAMENRILINPTASYLHGKLSPSKLYNI